MAGPSPRPAPPPRRPAAAAWRLSPWRPYVLLDWTVVLFCICIFVCRKQRRSTKPRWNFPLDFYGRCRVAS